MGYQNLHTHTTYVDGEKAPEEMIKTAIEKGGTSIGFSEHAYIPFDKEYSMRVKDIPAYVKEINELKEKYKGIIDVFLGVEADYYAEKVPAGLDYIIGVAHYIIKDGVIITVDGPAERLYRMAAGHYDNDFYEIAESYYATIAKSIVKSGADIVGHFDLIARNNDDGRMFDEKHPRYMSAALDSMEQILKYCTLFEINTGGMYRRGVSTPYPSVLLLKELQKRGGEVILSSDSHMADSLYYKFDEMRELVKSCGFKYIKRLTADGFVDEKL